MMLNSATSRMVKIDANIKTVVITVAVENAEIEESGRTKSCNDQG